MEDAIARGDHLAIMRYTLSLAEKSPPKPTNYRVGAVIVNPGKNSVLATGFTLELPGNTHAEQCCLLKLAVKHSVTEEELPSVLPTGLALYTTMEPCSHRNSGNVACAERILRLTASHSANPSNKAHNTVDTVYVGVMEPPDLVAENTGRKMLESAGVRFIHVSGLEDEILAIAKAGHVHATD